MSNKVEVYLLVKSGQGITELKKFGNEAGKAEKKLSRFGQSLKKIGAAAALGGVAALTAAGAALGKSISMASAAAEEAAKFSVVFASTGERVTQQLNEFGDQVGRNVYDLNSYAAALGDTLKPMGFTEDSAADLSVQLVELATDLSSFNNMPMDEALRRLQGTLIGSHENALKFGVIINENTLKAELAANGWDKLTGAQYEQAKVQARINLLMKGTTDAQGDAARTADSFANRSRALQAQLQETAIAVGSAWLPLGQDVLGAANDALVQMQPSIVHLSEAFAGLAETVGTPGADIEKLSGFIEAIAVRAEGLTGTVDQFRFLKDVISELLPDFSRFVDLTGAGKAAMDALQGVAVDSAVAAAKFWYGEERAAEAVRVVSERNLEAEQATRMLADAQAADTVMVNRLAIATDAAAEASRGYTLATQDELAAIDTLYASQTNLELMRAGLGSATGTATAAGQFGISQFASGTRNEADTQAGKKAADAYASAYKAQLEKRKSDVSSAVSSVLGEGFGVLGDIAGAIGLGGDDTGRAIAEDARRLASIAAGDFSGEAAQLLAQSNPELFKKVMESEDKQAVARDILADFQQGIDNYGLIDKEAAKNRIRNLLFAGEQRQQLMQELTQELLAEGQYSADQIQSAIGGELGTGDLQSAVVNEDQQAAVEAVKTSVLDIGTAAEDTSILMQESFALAAENLTTVLLPALDEVRMMLERVDALAVSSTGNVGALGTSVGLEPAGAGTGGPPPGSGAGYASGGSFIVPPGYQNDTYPMRVSSGERVTVQTPAQQQGGAGGGMPMVTVPVYLDGQKIAEVVSQHQGRRARNSGRLGGHTRL